MKLEPIERLATVLVLLGCFALRASLANVNSNTKDLTLKTTYTCDGNRMDLDCRGEGLIRLVRINYGRFSLSICNDYGHMNMSTQCMSMQAHRIMLLRCDLVSNCSVLVSSETFGDPCPGTTAYLEVQYHCENPNGHSQAKNNKISPPPPPLQPNQQQQSAATTQGQANGPSDQSAAPAHNQGGHKSPLNTSPLVVDVGQHFQPPTKSANPNLADSSSQSTSPLSALEATNLMMNGGQHRKQQPPVVVGGEQPQTTGENKQQQVGDEDQFVGPSIMIPAPNQQQQATASVINQQQLQSYCPPMDSERGSRWNYTRANQVARLNCPEGSSGRASWFCDPETLRFSPLWSPDFSQCKLRWLERLLGDMEKILQRSSSSLDSADTLLKQSNDLVRLIVNDLVLLTRTRELFSEDLKRIDQMLGQIIAQFRASQRLPLVDSTAFAALKEELFVKLVSIVSSLFESLQRKAWLELQPQDLRQKIELRLISYLRDSGMLLGSSSSSAAAGGGAATTNLAVPQIYRQANVFAGIVDVIKPSHNHNHHQHLQNPMRREFKQQLELVGPDPVTGEFKLVRQQQMQQQPMQLYGQLMSQMQPQQQQGGGGGDFAEPRLDGQLVKSLISNGVTKFLVLDVKRPDYSLIRAQLEAASLASSVGSSANAPQQQTGNSIANDLNGRQNPLTASMIMNLANNMENDPTLSSRVFGLFPIQDNADSFGRMPGWGSFYPNSPIEVNFKISGDGASGRLTLSGGPFKMCSSLDLDLISSRGLIGEANQEQADSSKCLLVRSNATNYACRCNQMGFVALDNLPLETQPVVAQPDEMSYTSQSDDSFRQNSQENSQSSYINAPNESGSKRSSIAATVITITIVVGISILVISLLYLLLGGFMRAASSNQSRLNKKQSFLSTGSSILARSDGNGAGPTTGPLIESHVGQLATSVTGATTSAYKGHNQQLYAAHLSSMDNYSSPTTTTTSGSYNRWLPSSTSRWTSNLLLHPTRWLAMLTGRDNSKGDGMIQHRVIDLGAGSLGSVVYKSQCHQNGYATNHLQRSPIVTNINLNNHSAPSSSTSSYLSSSAYYEEIGPGNLTKINPNQFNTTSHIPPRIDHHNHNHNHHHHHHQQQNSQTMMTPQHQHNWPPQTATAVSYPISPQIHYGQPISMVTNQQQDPLPPPPQRQCHNQDLNQHLQSSAFSAGSQSQSVASSQTTANSTPQQQHYLFALNQQQHH